ncbi:hypothetical protein CRUP_008110, partial [Coryphaenoides rupestris]
MSGRNGSASDADCRISEDCQVPDVALMELGPLLEEGGRPTGLIMFICLGTLTLLRPNMYFMAPLQEKVVLGMFFLGAVLCLSFSWLFHTVYCHSEKVSRTFS